MRMDSSGFGSCFIVSCLKVTINKSLSNGFVLACFIRLCFNMRNIISPCFFRQGVVSHCRSVFFLFFFPFLCGTTREAMIKTTQ